MTTPQLAKGIREEHAKVKELSNRLREQIAVIAWANLDDWIVEIRRRFDCFRAHLARHMALEESGGYLAYVSEARPALAGEVDRLKHEHAEITKIADSVHLAANALAKGDRLFVRDCCARIDKLLEYVERHEDEENLLVTSVFARDIGATD